VTIKKVDQGIIDEYYECYSVRKVSAGFRLANRQLCALTMVKAITDTIKPEELKMACIFSVIIPPFCVFLVYWAALSAPQQRRIKQEST
jgi:hypothetical protein